MTKTRPDGTNNLVIFTRLLTGHARRAARRQAGAGGGAAPRNLFTAKITSTACCLVAFIAASLALAAPVPPPAIGAGPPESRPPLDIRVDDTPLDRRSPAHFSYAPVVEETAASVVYV